MVEEGGGPRGVLIGEQQALLVTRDGRPEGVVTRTDLLEALV